MSKIAIPDNPQAHKVFPPAWISPYRLCGAVGVDLAESRMYPFLAYTEILLRRLHPLCFHRQAYKWTTRQACWKHFPCHLHYCAAGFLQIYWQFCHLAWNREGPFSEAVLPQFDRQRNPWRRSDHHGSAFHRSLSRLHTWLMRCSHPDKAWWTYPFLKAGRYLHRRNSQS